ncbi:nucleotidyltransferase family protein [Methyloferula stellata]|uniref:nucleotidyltransferase family protein n=1 Tax=Methyloferula stellata TaxID=876270 RepID=UPI00036C1E2D|nr:nucleotidyltransferase domain-containing protein [Methyloferula stellata]
MKPSIALNAHREDIRRIVAANRGLNPRVFGSVLHQEDNENSDLDLLIDAADGLSLFDMATIALAIEKLIEAKVDVRTPEDLPIKFRSVVLAEARPV